MKEVSMRAQKLGHAVLKVRSLEVSAAFYREVIGLAEVARYGPHMAFFSCGENHHDLALLEIGAQAAPPMDRQVGLYHLAFKVGDSLDELRACRDHLAAHGVPLAGQSDHRVSQALYCRDPDGLLVELYVDADPALWRDDPGAVAHVGELKL
jgi:catechol 2,3-dioxygenase